MKIFMLCAMFNLVWCLGLLVVGNGFAKEANVERILGEMIEIESRFKQYPCPQTVLADILAADRARQVSPELIRRLDQGDIEMPEIKKLIHQEVTRFLHLQNYSQARMESQRMTLLAGCLVLSCVNLLGFGGALWRIGTRTQEKRRLEQALETSQSELLNVKDTVKQRTRDMLTLKRDHKSLHEQFTAMLREAELDPKGTGAFTAKAGMNLLCKALRQNLSRRPVWVLLLDADRFKSVNDTYGHKAGDVVLFNLVSCVQSELRSEDFIFRYGGEEFVVVLTGVAAGEAFSIAERLRRKMEKLPIWIGSQSISVTFSAGLAGCHESELFELTRQRFDAQVTGEIDEKSLQGLMFNLAEETLAQADSLLYQAKHGGRNQVCRRTFSQSGRLLAI